VFVLGAECHAARKGPDGDLRFLGQLAVADREKSEIARPQIRHRRPLAVARTDEPRRLLAYRRLTHDLALVEVDQRYAIRSVIGGERVTALGEYRDFHRAAIRLRAGGRVSPRRPRVGLPALAEHAQDADGAKKQDELAHIPLFQ